MRAVISPDKVTKAELKDLIAVADKARPQPSQLDLSRCHSILSDFLLKEGDFAEAEMESRLALNLDPSYFPTYIRLGSALYGQGKWAEAESAYLKFIEENNRFWSDERNFSQRNELEAEVRLMLARIKCFQGRFIEAESEARRALQLNSNFWAAHVWLGICLLKQGKIDKAEKELSYALQKQSADNDEKTLLHYSLGVLYREKGMFDAAEEKFKEAEKLNSQVIRIYKQLLNKNSEKSKQLSD